MTRESTITNTKIQQESSKELQPQLIMKELQRKIIGIQLNVLEREKERISREINSDNLFWKNKTEYPN